MAKRGRRPVDNPRQARDLAALTEGEPDRLVLAVRPGQRLPGDDPGDDPRHLVQRQDEVGSGLGSSLRHRRLIGGVLALRDDQPTRLLDRPHSRCRVPAHAGEHDRERPSAEGVGEGAQHRVVRKLAGPALGVVHPARAVGEELDPLPGRRGDHPARAQSFAGACPLHLDSCAAGQQLRQRAPAAAEMLLHDDGNREVGPQASQHRRQRLEPTRRRDENNDIDRLLSLAHIDLRHNTTARVPQPAQASGRPPYLGSDGADLSTPGTASVVRTRDRHHGTAAPAPRCHDNRQSCDL
jgi:hypothetical protein